MFDVIKGPVMLDNSVSVNQTKLSLTTSFKDNCWALGVTSSASKGAHKTFTRWGLTGKLFRTFSRLWGNYRTDIGRLSLAAPSTNNTVPQDVRESWRNLTFGTVLFAPRKRKQCANNCLISCDKSEENPSRLLRCWANATLLWGSRLSQIFPLGFPNRRTFVWATPKHNLFGITQRAMDSCDSPFQSGLSIGRKVECDCEFSLQIVALSMSTWCQE